MHQQKPDQEPELGDGIVRIVDSLQDGCTQSKLDDSSAALPLDLAPHSNDLAAQYEELA